MTLSVNRPVPEDPGLLRAPFPSRTGAPGLRLDTVFVGVAGTAFLFSSAIKVPGFQAFTLFEVATFVLVGLVVARKAGGSLILRISGAHLAIFGLLAVVLVTMAMKGTGLTGGTIAGAAYLKLLGLSLLFLLSDELRLSFRQWRVVIYMLLAGAVVSMLAEFLVLAGSPGIGRFIFVSTEHLRALESGGGGLGVLRLRSFLNLSIYLLLGVTAVWAARGGPRHLLIWALFCIGLASLSGHRLGVGFIILYALLFASLAGRLRNSANILLAITLIATLLLFIVPIAPQMLPAVQRALSWIPGLGVQEQILQYAAATVDWRLLLWEEAWRMVPEHLVIGRGLAIPAHEYAVLLQAESPAAFNLGELQSFYSAIITRTYHNGPLGLLLNFGAAGLVLGFLFLAVLCIRHLRLAKWPPDAPVGPILTLYRTVVAILVVHVFVFLVVYGDIQANFLTILFFAALAEGLRTACLDEIQRSTNRGPAGGHP